MICLKKAVSSVSYETFPDLVEESISPVLMSIEAPRARNSINPIFSDSGVSTGHTLPITEQFTSRNVLGRYFAASAEKDLGDFSLSERKVTFRWCAALAAGFVRSKSSTPGNS
ncbi:MAG: hypothetical protein BWY32_03556 [bacterium ADurb.Bin243]|nr:MAG: hypothetical protein BWY32_03556 [bacterium ADurb.Bin243]